MTGSMNKISLSIPMTFILSLSIMSSLIQGRNLEILSPRSEPEYPPRSSGAEYPPEYQSTAAPDYAPQYAPAESPIDLSPETSAGFYDFLDECSKDLSPQCGEEIFGGVFGNSTVSKGCCHALVFLGQDCHEGLVETIIEIAVDGDEEKAIKYREKSVEVFNDCVLKVDNAPAPPPKLPSN